MAKLHDRVIVFDKILANSCRMDAISSFEYIENGYSFGCFATCWTGQTWSPRLNAFTDTHLPSLQPASEEAENINPENSSSNVTEEQEAGNGESTSNAGNKKFALPKIAAVVATLFISIFSLG